MGMNEESYAYKSLVRMKKQPSSTIYIVNPSYLVKKILLNIISLTIISANSFAENRKYQYLVISKPKKGNMYRGIFTSSTQNPIEKKTHHGNMLTKTDFILLNSWICPGNTSNRLPCKSKEIFKDQFSFSPYLIFTTVSISSVNELILSISFFIPLTRTLLL